MEIGLRRLLRRAGAGQEISSGNRVQEGKSDVNSEYTLMFSWFDLAGRRRSIAR